VLYGIDWLTYSRLLRVLQSDRRFRLTYDRGTLEIMAPLLAHDGPADLIDWFIKVLIEELKLSCRSGRTVTLRRRRRGLKPDCCYWIANASRLHGKKEIDLRVDPPPDLAVEVDVTSSSLDRMSIYLALGVPEIWRLASDGLTFNLLHQGKYSVRTNSLAFPRLAPTDLVPFLGQYGQTDDADIAGQFREWVRQNLLGGQTPPPSP